MAPWTAQYAHSPPRMVSSPLQPVLSATVLLRCSITTAAVVKVMGVIFQAAQDHAANSCQC
jgi:hypothetical protein